MIDLVDISEIKGRKRVEAYNNTNTCDRCRETSLIPTKAIREYDEKGNWTGKWICNKCYMKDTRKKHDSYENIIKQMRPCRTGDLDPNSNNAKGNNFQELTCIWRSIVSTIPVEDLNKKLDCYNTSIDHSLDSELGIIQTKGRFYNSKYSSWSHSFNNLHDAVANGFDFDHLIFYCANKDGKIIERIYIFPTEEVLKRISISIVKNPLRGIQWYEHYRVKDEETIKRVNEIWKEIINR